MGIFSAVLGLLDLVGYFRQSEPFFTDGSGGWEGWTELKAMWLSKERTQLSVINDLNWKITSVKRLQEHDVAQIGVQFDSPVRDFFPKTEKDEMKTALGELIVPLAWVPEGGDVSFADLAAGRRWAIHKPMTGDIGLGNRRRSYGIPLAKKGVGSVILYAPGYAKRRPHEWSGKSSMPTALDMARQACGIVTEGMVLARELRAYGASAVCYAGVSFGGAMATLATMQDVEPIANVSLVGCHSPYPAFEEGIMKYSTSETYDDECKKMLRELQTHVFPPDEEGSNALRVIHHRFAKNDWYIPAWSSERMFEDASARPGVTKNSSREGYTGGHAYAIIKRAPQHVELIVRALHELEDAIEERKAGGK